MIYCDGGNGYYTVRHSWGTLQPFSSLLTSISVIIAPRLPGLVSLGLFLLRLPQTFAGNEAFAVYSSSSTDNIYPESITANYDGSYSVAGSVLTSQILFDDFSVYTENSLLGKLKGDGQQSWFNESACDQYSSIPFRIFSTTVMGGSLYSGGEMLWEICSSNFCSGFSYGYIGKNNLTTGALLSAWIITGFSNFGSTIYTVLPTVNDTLICFGTSINYGFLLEFSTTLGAVLSATVINADISVGSAIAINDSFYVIGGYSQSTAITNVHGFLSKISHTGLSNVWQILWTNIYSSSDGDVQINSIAAQGNDVVFAGNVGNSNSDGLIGSVNGKTGTVNWITSIGGASSDSFSDIAIKSNGLDNATQIVAVGTTQSGTIGGSAAAWYLLMNLNNGTLEKTVTLDGSGNDYATSVVANPDRTFTSVGYTSSEGSSSNNLMFVTFDENGRIDSSLLPPSIKYRNNRANITTGVDTIQVATSSATLTSATPTVISVTSSLCVVRDTITALWRDGTNYYPTSQPSNWPSSQPSSQPTTPSGQPSTIPSGQPSSQPSRKPSKEPTGQPTEYPSDQSTSVPSSLPTIQPSLKPTSQPTGCPNSFPTDQPTGNPSYQPTADPSFQPSIKPTVQPTESPTNEPSSQPITQPSRQPVGRPTAQPTAQPTQPTGQPTVNPTSAPTTEPTLQTSSNPTSSPTLQPSTFPSVHPSSRPSTQPSVFPSAEPSFTPILHSSLTPTPQPSSAPIFGPSVHPSIRSSSSPNSQQERFPSTQPSGIPTGQPSSLPTVHPSDATTAQPIALPTVQPTSLPSDIPTSQSMLQPSSQPTAIPTAQPFTLPSQQPSSKPSVFPTAKPTSQPTDVPAERPTSSPTIKIESGKTLKPSHVPSMKPTKCPTEQPTSHPTKVVMSVRGQYGVYTHNGFKITTCMLGILQNSQPALSDISLGYPMSGTNSVILGSKQTYADIYLSQPSNGEFYIISHPPALSLDTVARSAFLGDMNMDGYKDLIIGDIFASKVYLFFGNQEGLINMNIGATIFGETANDFYGWSVASAGDFNGDGSQDLISSAINVGKTYIAYGTFVQARNIKLAQLTTQEGLIINAQAGATIGIAVAGIGDINGDGYADVAISAVFQQNSLIYIIFGFKSDSNNISINLDNLNADQGVVVSAPIFTGFSLDSLGDINLDGYDDFVIGSIPYKGGYQEQISYVIYGSSAFAYLNSSLDLSSLPVDRGFRIIGAGFIVNGPGDLNNDGINDILVTNYQDWQGKSATYISVIPMNNTSPPTLQPSSVPTSVPSPVQTTYFLAGLTQTPSNLTTPPTAKPTISTSNRPTKLPSLKPTFIHTYSPTVSITNHPTVRTTIKTSVRSTLKAPSLSPISYLSSYEDVMITNANENNPECGNKLFIIEASDYVSISCTLYHNIYKLLPSDTPLELVIQKFDTKADIIDLILYDDIHSIDDISYSTHPLTLKIHKYQQVVLPQYNNISSFNNNNFIFSEVPAKTSINILDSNWVGLLLVLGGSGLIVMIFVLLDQTSNLDELNKTEAKTSEEENLEPTEEEKVRTTKNAKNRQDLNSENSQQVHSSEFFDGPKPNLNIAPMQNTVKHQDVSKSVRMESSSELGSLSSGSSGSIRSSDASYLESRNSLSFQELIVDDE